MALAEQISQYAARAEPVRVVGGGTWLDAGRPCHGSTLALGEHAGIVDYVPGDLTLTARAGTPLDEVRAATAAHGQWFPLDPVAGPGATIGATVATASDGPLAGALGRVRDLVLGLECVTGDGTVIRAGGRVVKNVAGFDLVRLQTGAWGTLGVITEVTVRLRARPLHERCLVLRGDERMSLEARLAPLVDLRLEPLAMELLSPALASALGVHNATCVLVRLGGNAEHVEAQAAALAAVGDVDEVRGDVFESLAALESPHDMVARVSYLPSHLSATWRHVMDCCTAHQWWQPLASASLARGVVRVVLPAARAGSTHDATMGATSAFVRSLLPPGGHVAWERLPASLWPLVAADVDDALSTSLRRTFDPSHILNRGLLGEAAAIVRSGA